MATTNGGTGRLLPGRAYAGWRAHTIVWLLLLPGLMGGALMLSESHGNDGAQLGGALVALIFWGLFWDESRRWRKPVLVSPDGVQIWRPRKRRYVLTPQEDIDRFILTKVYCEGKPQVGEPRRVWLHLLLSGGTRVELANTRYVDAVVEGATASACLFGVRVTVQKAWEECPW